MTYIIKDWAGNVMNWGTFDSEDDAYAELLLRAEDSVCKSDYYAEEDINSFIDEYHIIEVKNEL